jgi:hypothetical protein
MYLFEDLRKFKSANRKSAKCHITVGPQIQFFRSGNLRMLFLLVFCLLCGRSGMSLKDAWNQIKRQHRQRGPLPINFLSGVHYPSNF